jgi:hypothetical protein
MKMFPAVVLLTLLLPGTTALFAETDKQFVQSDEIFVTDDPYTDQDWIYAYLAKEIKPASKDTKFEAQVQVYGGDKTKWTKNAFRTRIAATGDLKVGAVVVMLDARDSEGLYRAPTNRVDALESSWFMARIMDVSDLFKDVVTVSGGYSVNIDAVRIVVKP